MATIAIIKKKLRVLASYTIFPLGMCLFVWLYIHVAAASGNLADFENLPGIGLLSFVTIGVIIILEWVLPFNKSWNIYRLEDGNDFLHFVFSALSADTLSRIAVNMAAPMLLSRMPNSWLIWPTAWPFGLQVCFALFLYDFTYYWYHRLFHGSKWLWRIHRIHHSSHKLTFSKTFRFNFIEIFIENLLLLGVLKLFAAPPEVMVWAMAMVNFTVLVKHANLDVRFPRWLDWVFVSPGNHRRHHSSDLTESNSNFGGFTMLWDVLFGTYKNGLDYSGAPLGVKGHKLSTHFLGQAFDFLKP